MPDPTTTFAIDLKPLTRLMELVASGCGILLSEYIAEKRARAVARALPIEVEALVSAKETLNAAGFKLASVELPSLKATVEDLGSAQREREFTNVSAVTNKAAALLHASMPEEVDIEIPEEPTDHDWSSRFFDGVRAVSNEDLQNVWAHLLASEATKPGSVSRRTIEIARSLTPAEARAFQSICGVCIDRAFALRYRPLTSQLVAGLALSDFQKARMDKRKEVTLLIDEVRLAAQYDGLDLEQLAYSLQEARLLYAESPSRMTFEVHDGVHEFRTATRIWRITRGASLALVKIDVPAWVLTDAGSEICKALNIHCREEIGEIYLEALQAAGLVVTPIESSDGSRPPKPKPHGDDLREQVEALQQSNELQALVNTISSQAG